MWAYRGLSVTRQALFSTEPREFPPRDRAVCENQRPGTCVLWPIGLNARIEVQVQGLWPQWTLFPGVIGEKRECDF